MDYNHNESDRQATFKHLTLYIFMAFIVGLLARLILYYQASDNSDYFYNGEIIPLWNPDAGLYGFYASQLLDGIHYPFVAEYVPGYLLYGLVSLTGMSLDTALFFAPMFFASLIVIPIILLANQYHLAKMGFYAAVIGSIMTSYYYRTHLGYYDTDMLNVFFPLMSIYFLIRLVESKNILNALYASLTLILFSLWYHSAAAIIVAIIGMAIVYLVLFERKSTYMYQSIVLLSIALVPLMILYKLLILLTIGILFKTNHTLKSLDHRYYLALFTLLLVLFVSLVDSNQYYERANDYINKSSLIEVVSNDRSLHFKSDLATVMEAQSINIFDFMYRVSGATPIFIIALLGYLMLLRKYKSMLFTLPLVLLMFIGMVAGLRFLIYGVMIFAFALVYGTFNIFGLLLSKWGELSKQTTSLFSHLFLLAVMYFSVLNIWNYNKLALSPTFFETAEEMQILESLKDNSQENDFILSWWDYGWPLWYYTNLKTLIDNGKHQQDNFIVSKILLSDNQDFSKNASVFFVEKYFEGQSKGFSRVMDYFSSQYTLDYLNQLKSPSINLPEPKREIYILLHKYMLSTLTTIESFSNLNPKTGKLHKSNYLNLGTLKKSYQKSQKMVYTDDFSIDMQKGEITGKQGSLPLKKAAIIDENKITFEKNYFHTSLKSKYLIIVGDEVMLLNEKLYHSFLIQALLFQNYDAKHFSKVAQSKNFLILKVKQ